MSKPICKVDTSLKPQIKDSLGADLYPGDVILFVSSRHKNSYGLSSGVFLNHFDNGSGWKIRIRVINIDWRGIYRELSDNSLIDDNGYAYGIVRVEDPKSIVHIPRIKMAYDLKQKMIKDGKIKPSKETSVLSTPKTTDATKLINTTDLLNSLGAPKSLK